MSIVDKTPPQPRQTSIPSNLIPTLVVLMVAGCLTSMTGGAVNPVFPEIVEELAVDARWSGTLVSMHTLTTALGSPLFGILADRLGKLRVLIPALFAYGLVGVSSALAQDFSSLLIMRGLLGLANGGIAAASIGFVGSLFEGEERSRLMGYVASVLATASILFPLLGGWAGSFHWRYAFGLYGLAFPVAIAALMIIREHKAGEQSASGGSPTVNLTITRGLGQTLLQPPLLFMFLGLGLSSAVFYVVIVYAPQYFKQTIGADTILNGIILASRAVGAAIVSAIGASRLAQKLGVYRAIALGFAIMAGTLAVIPTLEQPLWIIMTALLFGMGFGAVMPNLYDALARLTPVEQRSGILAIGTGVASLGQFLSPIVMGPIWKNQGPIVFSVAAGVAIAFGLLQLLSENRLIARPKG